MKRIFDGLMYDTEKATLIYFDEANGRSYFMTEKKNFFVVYRTGELRPCSEDFVKDILGQYDVDSYVEIFGECEEA